MRVKAIVHTIPAPAFDDETTTPQPSPAASPVASRTSRRTSCRSSPGPCDIERLLFLLPVGNERNIVHSHVVHEPVNCRIRCPADGGSWGENNEWTRIHGGIPSLCMQFIRSMFGTLFGTRFDWNHPESECRRMDRTKAALC